MFFGQWEQKVDEKGRVTIPKRFRDELGKEVIVTLNSGGFIRVYPRENAEKLTPSSMWFVELDKQGRVPIPKRLKIQGQKMVWYGEGDYLELRPE